MAIYCAKCGEQRHYPMSSIRTSRTGCDFCGGFDKINVTRNGEVVRQMKLPNYSYPTQLLPSVIEEAEER